MGPSEAPTYALQSWTASEQSGGSGKAEATSSLPFTSQGQGNYLQMSFFLPFRSILSAAVPDYNLDHGNKYVNTTAITGKAKLQNPKMAELEGTSPINTHC